MNKKDWENNRYSATPLVSPRNDVWGRKAKAEILYWWRVTRSDLGSASDWSCQVGNLLQPIRRTTQMCVVTRHQYGISALVSQTSFCGETSGVVAKCRLLFQGMNKKASRPSSVTCTELASEAMTKVRYTYTCDDYLPWPAAFFSSCAV